MHNIECRNLGWFELLMDDTLIKGMGGRSSDAAMGCVGQG
jgi:hypothetical protein